MGRFLYLLFILTFLLPVGHAIAGLSFVPRLIGYAGDLSVEGGYDISETDSETVYENDSLRNNKNTDHFRNELFRNSLNLATAGYMYHPNLFFFQLEGSAFYEHERQRDKNIIAVNRTNVKVTHYRATETTFNFVGKIFQKKPFNVEIYRKQEQPFVTQRDSSDRLNNLANSGIKLNYRKDGLLSNFKFDRQDEERIRDADASFDFFFDEIRTDEYTGFVSYYVDNISFLEKVNLGVWGTHQERTNEKDENDKNKPLDSENTFDDLNLSSSFKYKVLEFNNTFSYRENDSAIENDVTTETNILKSFNQRVRATLPWDFTSVLNYRLTRNDTERNDISSPLPDVNSSKVDYYDFVLTQKLFSSLVTNIRTSLSNNESTSGSSEVKRYSAETNYSKKLPKNSRLQAGLGTYTTWLDRENVLVDDRRQPLSVGHVKGVGDGIFLLDSAADRDLPIWLWVLNENKGGCAEGNNGLLDPSCWLLLTEDIHYEIGTTFPFEITVFGGLQDALVGTYSDPYIYKLKTSYYTTEENVKSDRSDFFINLNLFGMLNGEYSHTVVRQDFDENATRTRGYEGISPKTTDDQLWFSVSMGPYWGRAGYQLLEADGRQETYDLTLNYKKDEIPTGIKFIKAGLALDYTYRDIATETEELSTRDTNIRASYDFWSLATVPKVNVLLTYDSTYEYLRGDNQKIILTGQDVYRLTPQTGLSDRDVFYNALTATRKFIEPRTKIQTKIWGKGSWENTTGSDNTFVERYEYGLRANRAWIFGRTTFNLSARYRVTETIDTNDDAKTENDRVISDTLLMFKMVRKLF